MPPHEIQMLITAKNEADRALRELRTAHAAAGRAIQQNWAQVNRANTTGFNRFASGVQSQLRALRAGFAQLGQAAGRVFASMGRAAVNFGRRAASLGALTLLGGTLVGTQRAVSLTFEQQRQQALFRATRADAAQRAQLEAFANRQAGGLFTRQQVLEGITAGRRIQDPQDLMRLVQALRGAAAAEGDLALAVTAVQRAMFEGEAELAERFGLLLREGNLTERANELFGLKVTQLTAAQKAQVVYAEAIAQSANFQDLENEMLKTAAGQWQLFKNRVDETLRSIGQGLQPVLEGILGFINEPIARLRTFGSEMLSAYQELFRQLLALIKDVLANIEVSIENSVVRIINRFPRIAQFLGISTTQQLRQPIPLQPLNVPGFGQAFRNLFAPVPLRAGAVRREEFGPFVPSSGLSPVPVPESALNIMELQRAEQRRVANQREAALQNIEDVNLATRNFTMDMRNQFISAFAEIGSITNSGLGDFVAAIANMIIQIQQILSQFQQTNALRTAAGLGPLSVVHPGIGIATVAITAGATIIANQQSRSSQRRAQRQTRFSHSGR